ncbi:MAG: ABC transporter permease [Candidatus Kapabacteria bacterium]|nr:ABC transporter permease [Candidatus Kapabacteria bacterium]
MNLFIKILKYELNNIMRSKWVIAYFMFFLVITEVLFRFSGDSSRVLVGLMNIALLLIPLVSIIFGTIHFYNSREFMELLLAQPVKRNVLFSASWLGLVLPLSLAYVMGLALPFLLHGTSDFAPYLILLSSGVILSFIFVGLAFIIALKITEKSFGVGLAFIVWLFFGVIYDGLIMLIIWQFSDYPLEAFMIGISSLNPIDLCRITIMLKFDIAALMGYTGAIFEKFFGSLFGIGIAFSMLMAWILIPYLIAKRLFNKKDF